MAKFPPDDDAPLPDAPAPAPQPEASPDGNFKRGRFNPIIIILVLATLIGGAVALYFVYKKDKERMSPETRAKVMQDIFLLPATDQVPKWKTWAESDDEEMVQEALLQLAQLKDDSAVPMSTKALSRKNHAINGTAAMVLASYGSPKADEAKPALLAALKEADESDKQQIVWALVTLKEASIFKDAMELYRKGKLAQVKRVDGGRAFDPDVLATLVSVDDLAAMAGDESQAVRQLVATALSRTPDPKWTDVLIRLVNDSSIDVAAAAANGLGRIGDEKAREPLLKKIAESKDEQRRTFLLALRDGIGGEGLVLALRSINRANEQTSWFQHEQIFSMLEELADPRAADALVKWVEETKPEDHWRSEAGMRLAEIGDIRAVKYLAERMTWDPTKMYVREKFWQKGAGGHLSQTEDQRIWAMRMLADLAAIYGSTKRDELLVGEKAILDYITSKPSPHANGLRFLANIRSEEAVKRMREWAFPEKKPLPKLGDSCTKNNPDCFPVEFATAQSALRYIGRMHDEDSFDKLLKNLEIKKDKDLDITTEGLMGAGAGMLGMVLRGLGLGTAEGLGEFGDKRAVKPLMEFVEDMKWNEDARDAGCAALAWCATPDDMREIAKRAIKFAGEENAKKKRIGVCYATTLSMRPMPEVVPDLVDLIEPKMEPAMRNMIARSIGATKLTDASRDKLFEKLKDPETRNAAALALIMGGDTSTAAQTIAHFGTLDDQALNDLKDAYFRAFGYWSDEDLKLGNLYRWVDNAEAIARVKIHGAPQLWAIERLSSQFDNLKYDNGPHSETRVVLRYRLLKVTKEGDDTQKAAAIRTLKFMKEKGVLMSLRGEQGVVGELARVAFHELLNPKPIEADAGLKNLQAEQAAKARSN
ncbi:MAG: HEAT repeat domain-containing protein [Polyangiaceae bacterium]